MSSRALQAWRPTPYVARRPRGRPAVTMGVGRATVGARSERLKKLLETFATRMQRDAYNLFGDHGPHNFATPIALQPLIVHLIGLAAIAEAAYLDELSIMLGFDVRTKEISSDFGAIVSSISGAAGDKASAFLQTGTELLRYRIRLSFYLDQTNRCIIEGRPNDHECVVRSVTLPLLLGLRNTGDNEDPTCIGDEGSATCRQTISDASAIFVIMGQAEEMATINSETLAGLLSDVANESARQAAAAAARVVSEAAAGAVTILGETIVKFLRTSSVKTRQTALIGTACVLALLGGWLYFRKRR